jgi:hypothetical protein
MAAGATYEPIATTTLSTATASVTFSSISGSYTDLVVVINGLYSGTTYGKFTFNSDTTSSNYSYIRMLGYSGGTLTDRAGGTDGISLGSTRGTWIAHIQNYANSTTYKSVLARENNGGSGVGAYVYLWRSTAAITSVTFTGVGGNFDSTTTFTLYGIAAA